MEAKWFTGARRFPQLIGRTPNGSKLPGGPYTITQMGVAVVMLWLLWNSTWLWARFGLIGNLVAGLGLLVGSVYAAGRLPFGMRNPLVVGSGWLLAVERLISDPAPVRLRRPHCARGQVLMICDAPPLEVTPDADPMLDASVSAPPLTGVQLLLAARR